MQYNTFKIAAWLLVLAGLGISAYLLLKGDNDKLMASSKKTDIEFSDNEIDLGTIKQGVPKTISIPFTNTGDHPLVIYNVETSCGCTEVQWPEKPVRPQKHAEISVSYDAKLPGRFIKTITIYGNFKDGSKRIQIKGEVNINKHANLAPRIRDIKFNKPSGFPHLGELKGAWAKREQEAVSQKIQMLPVPTPFQKKERRCVTKIG